MAPLVTLPPIASPPILTPTELADGYALGSPDAPVTVEVWADFQCPYCQAFTFSVEPRIVDAYVVPGRVRLVYRDMAFLGEESRWATVAASLAADQGLFWPYHDHLFANLYGENVGSYALDRLVEIGRRVGLDMDAFVAGLQVEPARARYAELEAGWREDASRLGIRGTPSVVVNGVKTEYADWETVTIAIDEALAAADA
jgi:protein-disulfide isomerase